MFVKHRAREMPLFLIATGLLLTLAAWELLAPGNDFSALENRPLARASTPTLAAIASGDWMERAEAATADQFPLRERWIALQALEDAALLRNQRNGILIGRDGWLFEPASKLDTRTARENIAALNKIAAHAGVPVTLMLVPMSSAVYPGALPADYPADDQAALIGALYGGAKRVKTIPLLEALLAGEEKEPLFFRTDHHWTVAGAKAAYGALREAWRLPVANGPTDSLVLPDGHYGSYFARAPNPFLRPDAFALEYPAGVSLEVEGTLKDGLYDPEAIAGERNKYAQLLYGNHGRITLNGLAEDGVLLVIKDSYANLLLPWLAQHYRRVEAIDPRFYTGDLYAWLQEREGEEEVNILCVYGLTTWLTDRNLLRRVASWGD